jgi:hypothetical protein
MIHLVMTLSKWLNLWVAFLQGSVICQTSPVRTAQAKDSTLGPLTKHQRVGAGPALGWDELNYLDRNPWQFPMVPAHCGQKTQENERTEKKSEKRMKPLL